MSGLGGLGQDPDMTTDSARQSATWCLVSPRSSADRMTCAGRVFLGAPFLVAAPGLPAHTTWARIIPDQGGARASAQGGSADASSGPVCWVIAVGFGIGSTRPNSLLGETGSRFWLSEWGYPPIGAYFADCPSAGHDMLAFDDRACGPKGEPAVVHVDQELDYAVTHVAGNFEAFLLGLQDCDAFEEEGASSAGSDG